MPTWLKVVLVVLGVVVALAIAASTYAAWRLRNLPDTRDLAAQIDRAVEKTWRTADLGTVAVAVLRDGRVHISRLGQGAGTPDDTTRFEIGSITKVLTVLAAQCLVGQGTWRWSDAVWPLLPTDIRPGTDDGTTLDMLATHTAGLPRLPDSWLARLDSAADPYAALTPTDVFAAYASGEGRTPWARAKEDYSNLGMGLLGHLMERRTGETYDALVQRLILRPLGMTNTSIALTPEQARQLVPGRDPDGKVSAPWTFGALAGAGAYRSTIEDMVTLLRAAVDMTPVPHLDWRATWTPRPSASGAMVARGWQLDDISGRLVGIRRIVWHNGGTGGFSSWIGFDPERRIGAVVLAARSSEDVDGLGIELLYIASHTSFGKSAPD